MSQPSPKNQTANTQSGMEDDAQSISMKQRGNDRRRTLVDRRTEQGTGLERRRGPGRRRSDFMKAAEEGELTQEQFLFVAAIDVYKRVNQRPYPSWTEILEVIRKLGYRKTSSSELQLDNVEDWTEPSDSPAFTLQQSDW